MNLANSIPSLAPLYFYAAIISERKDYSLVANCIITLQVTVIFSFLFGFEFAASWRDFVYIEIQNESEMEMIESEQLERIVRTG